VRALLWVHEDVAIQRGRESGDAVYACGIVVDDVWVDLRRSVDCALSLSVSDASS
jgi:hypothetical protein